MNYEINRKANKSGKGVVFFVTVQGMRFNNINYRKKWEAERIFKDFVKTVGEEKILSFITSNKKALN